MTRNEDAVQLHGVGNRLVGNITLLVALLLFGPYTVWTILLPFLPDDSIVHTLVPDRRWAITAPSLVLVIGIGTVFIYAGILLRRDALEVLAKQRAE